MRSLRYLLALSILPVCAHKRESSTTITHSPKEMAEHKRMHMEHMRSNPLNLRDSAYQMQRALTTILGSDCDYIPKVVGAGEIFKEGNVQYQLMHNGVKIILNSYYDSQWITDVIYGLKGHHESQEEKCFYEVLKYMPAGATMLELGSFWAYYSLWFMVEIENAKTYLIEPDPHRLEIGKKNFALNNRTGKFFRGYVGTPVDHDPDYRGADWISVDDFIEAEKIEHVHMLHADVQGSEFGMLQSAVRNLHKIDYFFISTHGDQVHAQCWHFLKNHGYTILAEHTSAQSYSGDGLIVAKRKGVHGPESIDIQKLGIN